MVSHTVQRETSMVGTVLKICFPVAAPLVSLCFRQVRMPVLFSRVHREPLVIPGPEDVTFIISFSLVVTQVPQVRVGEGPLAIAALISGGMCLIA